MAVSAFVARSNGFGTRIIIDPSAKDVARDIGRRINKPMKKEVGKLHKKHAEKPVEETRKRADALGSGRVRIGRSVRSSATQSAMTMLAGGGKYPDFAGQEYGALQYRQFLTWSGSGQDAGYVIGAMMRDDVFMEDLLEEYAEGLEKLIKLVWNE